MTRAVAMCLTYGVVMGVVSKLLRVMYTVSYGIAAGVVK